jgi:hypothetical protein
MDGQDFTPANSVRNRSPKYWWELYREVFALSNNITRAICGQRDDTFGLGGDSKLGTYL